MVDHGASKCPVQILKAPQVAVVMNANLVNAPSGNEAQFVCHLPPKTLVADSYIAAQFVNNPIELVEIDILALNGRCFVNG